MMIIESLTEFFHQQQLKILPMLHEIPLQFTIMDNNNNNNTSKLLSSPISLGLYMCLFIMISYFSIVYLSELMFGNYNILSSNKRGKYGKFPTPPGSLPIMGHLLNIMDKKNLAIFFQENVERYYDGNDNGIDNGNGNGNGNDPMKNSCYEFHVFGIRFCVIGDLDSVRKIHQYRPKKFRRLAHDLRANKNTIDPTNVFNAEGSEWGRHRRLTSPAFSDGNINKMKHSISHCIENNLIGKWEKQMKENQNIVEERQQEGQEEKEAEDSVIIDVVQDFKSFTSEFICDVAFKYKFENREVKLRAIDLLNDFGNTIANISRIWYWLTYRHNKRIEKRRNELLDIIRNIIQVTKKNLDRDSISISEIDADAGAGSTLGNTTNTNTNTNTMNKMGSGEFTESLQGSLLGKLLEVIEKNEDEKDTKSGNGGGFTEEDLIGNTQIFFVAGTDTTAVSLSWTLYRLAIDKELCQSLQCEIDGVFQNAKTKNLSIEEIYQDIEKDFPLSFAVIKETLRLYTVAPFTFEKNNEDVELGGILIPKDTLLITMKQCNALKNENFTDAKKFWPQRWFIAEDIKNGVIDTTDENNVKYYNFKHNEKAYMPFGGGPRICPGRKLAYTEMLMTLTKLVHKFDFELPLNHPKVERKMELVCEPSELKIKVTPRKIVS